MTKEPIIIDDIDVSGCKYLDITKSGRAQCMDYKRESNRADCKCNNDCYYKQLKHKEEECEELRDELEWVHGYKDILKEKYDKIDATNERLVKEKYDLHQDILQLKEENVSLRFDLSKSYTKEWVDEQIKIKKIYEEDRQNYGQALLEIKEIAEKVLKECNNCDQFSCYGCPDENKDELAQPILQKINEVLND